MTVDNTVLPSNDLAAQQNFKLTETTKVNNTMITNSGTWGICPNLLNPDTLKGPPEQVPQATGWTPLMNYKPTSKNEASSKVSGSEYVNTSYRKPGNFVTS
jgi:hypothetical protein